MTAASSATALAYRLGWTVLRRLPAPVVARGLDVVADAIWRRRGASVDRLSANLARAVSTDDALALDRLSRRAMRSYLRYWGETFRLPTLTPAQIRAGVVTVDEHRLRDAYAAGRGVVGALPHMGNWDLAGAWACGEQMPVMTVAERLSPERLYEDFLRYRRALGMHVLPLTGGDNPTVALLRYLRAGGFVCLLADRDLTGTGADVDLLGEPARLALGPALIARRTGAALLPITTSYVDAKLCIRFHDPVAHRPGRDGAVAMTADVAAAFSVAIRADPADWHMLQPVFSADLAASAPSPRGAA